MTTWRPWIPAVVAMLIGTSLHVRGSDETVPTSMAALRIIIDDGEKRGTAVLIAREDRAHDTVLYFLTSSRLFVSAAGERRAPQVLQMHLGNTHSLDVNTTDVMFVGGTFVELAIVRATGSKADAELMAPATLAYNPPPIGSAFFVVGPEGDDTMTVAEHVGFESTLFIVGDRDASGLAGCVGAPALSPDGVFGIVRDCEPNRPPVVSLLSMARNTLERRVPGRTTSEVLTPRVVTVSDMRRSHR